MGHDWQQKASVFLSQPSHQFSQRSPCRCVGIDGACTRTRRGCSDYGYVGLAVFTACMMAVDSAVAFQCFSGRVEHSEACIMHAWHGVQLFLTGTSVNETLAMLLAGVCGNTRFSGKYLQLLHVINTCVGSSSQTWKCNMRVDCSLLITLNFKAKSVTC